MPEEEIPSSKQDQLTLAIAHGQSINAWALQNEVPRTTAYRWANDPDVRRQVDDCRRRCLDRALGGMAGRSMRAVQHIIKLGESAESESVQLRAQRAILLDQITVAKHANLEYRMSQIEEKLRARTGHVNGQG